MSKLYLLPGLGDDHRIFEGIDLQGHEAVNVVWLEPEKQDTLSTYAQKLIDAYHITPQSIIIGNSLGGMLGIEIAKRIELNKVILISSIKTADEASIKSRLKRYIPFYLSIRSKLGALVKFMIRPFIGQKARDRQELFNNMEGNTSAAFYKWAKYAITYWDNQTVPKNVYHINGDQDNIFPYKRIKDAIIIKGGTHIMIRDKKNEINALLKEILSN
jgi:pimeloyl-ACP methyl ester carboxylesterase